MYLIYKRIYYYATLQYFLQSKRSILRELTVYSNMGNLMKTTFKNFELPNVDIDFNSLQGFKVFCSKITQNRFLQIDTKFKYKTVNLKTQSIVDPQSQFIFNGLKSLKILTYNVWFEEHNINNRINAIFEIIMKADADIICLQQVTEKFMQQIWKNSKYLSQKGDIYLPAIPMHWYDTIIISKFPLTFYQIPFKQSTMSRNLLCGLFQIVTGQGQIINCSINCVHLESLNNQRLRIQQLKEIQEINKNIDLVILAGDLNFSDDWKEDKIIKQHYIDIWEQFKQKNAEKWTMPFTKKFLQWRPDHILIKNNKIGNEGLKKSKKFQGKIDRVGLFTIQPFQNQQVKDIQKDGMVRTPSDHLGLLANLRFC